MSPLIAVLGDSNAEGKSIPTQQDTDQGFRLTTPFSSVTEDHRFNLSVVNNPPSWLDYHGSLAPYTRVDANPGMGIELQLGRRLVANGAISPWVLVHGIGGASLNAHWLPGSAYPTGGPPLFSQWSTRVQSFESSSGLSLSAVVVFLGGNDGLDSTATTNLTTNVPTFANAVWAIWPGIPILWVRPSINAAIANLTAARANLTSAIAALATTGKPIQLVDCDDCPLADAFHPTGNGYITLGDRTGVLAMEALDFPVRQPASTPAVVGVGPVSYGAGALTVIGSPESRARDLDILVVVTQPNAAALTTPSGWTLVCSGVTAAIGFNVQLGVYSKPNTTGGSATAVVPDTNAENAAKIFTVRGHNGNPTVTASLLTAPNTLASSFTLGAVADSGSDSALALMIVGGLSGGARTVTTTAAGLTSVALVQDTSQLVVSNVNIIHLTTGALATRGSTGNATVTADASIWGIGAMLTVVDGPRIRTATRSADDYAGMLVGLLPPGKLWRFAGSLLSKLLLGSGDELARVDARTADLLDEADPTTATELLPEYERELALTAAPTIDERRANIAGRLVRRQRFRPIDFQQALATLLAQDPAAIVVIERTRAFVISIGDDREIFRFFIYRDPALPGTAFISSAQALVTAMQPSHTLGTVIESTSFKYRDPHSLYGRDLMGP